MDAEKEREILMKIIEALQEAAPTNYRRWAIWSAAGKVFGYEAPSRGFDK